MGVSELLYGGWDLSEKREDVLPEKPYVWCHTTGKTGTYKWAPYTKKMYRVMGGITLAGLIFATSRKKGNFLLLVPPAS